MDGAFSIRAPQGRLASSHEDCEEVESPRVVPRTSFPSNGGDMMDFLQFIRRLNARLRVIQSRLERSEKWRARDVLTVISQITVKRVRDRQTNSHVSFAAPLGSMDVCTLLMIPPETARNRKFLTSNASVRSLVLIIHRPARTKPL